MHKNSKNTKHNKIKNKNKRTRKVGRGRKVGGGKVSGGKVSGGKVTGGNSKIVILVGKDVNTNIAEQREKSQKDGKKDVPIKLTAKYMIINDDEFLDRIKDDANDVDNMLSGLMNEPMGNFKPIYEDIIEIDPNVKNTEERKQKQKRQKK